MINRGHCVTLVLLDKLSTRSSLDLNIVNMLVCLQDWCRWHWSSNFQYISVTLNWLVILLSSLTSTTYVLFF